MVLPQQSTYFPKELPEKAAPGPRAAAQPVSYGTAGKVRTAWRRSSGVWRPALAPAIEHTPQGQAAPILFGMNVVADTIGDTGAREALKAPNRTAEEDHREGGSARHARPHP